MQVCRRISTLLLSPHCVFKSVPAAGVKSYSLPPDFSDVEFPDRMKLKVMSRAPQYPPNIRPFKTQKRLRLMRGPEEYHNTLLHRQYGIIATSGGRLKYNNFDLQMFRYKHATCSHLFLFSKIILIYVLLKKYRQKFLNNTFHYVILK